MSEIHTQDPKSIRSRPGPKLDEHQKRTILAQVIAGLPKTVIAKEHDISANSVHNLVARMSTPIKTLQDAWRERYDELTPKSVETIHEALDDSDVSSDKRASIAQTHLKGVGIYAADSTTTNVLVQAVVQLPADWQTRYLSADDIASGDTTTGGAVECLHSTELCDSGDSDHKSAVSASDIDARAGSTSI